MPPILSEKQKQSSTGKHAVAEPSYDGNGTLFTRTHMAEMTDRELLDQFRNGDNSNYAFNLLVRKYQQRVYLHIRRIVIDHDDANDVVQNTFIKAWNGLNNFRGDSEVFTWLYRIATNESITFLKKKRTKFFIPFVDVERQLAASLESDPLINADHIQLKFQKALLTLPEKQRIVFNLRYFDEMPYEEMSKVLGTSVGALKASYHFAAKKIEKYMIGD